MTIQTLFDSLSSQAYVFLLALLALSFWVGWCWGRYRQWDQCSNRLSAQEIRHQRELREALVKCHQDTVRKIGIAARHIVHSGN